MMTGLEYLVVVDYQALDDFAGRIRCTERLHPADLKEHNLEGPLV
jgi:hypothetical protein